MKDNLVYIFHIRESIEDISDYVDNINYDEFQNDKKTCDAVIKKLEVIGEACNKCSVDFRQKYNQVPWRKIIAARNKFSHDYFGIIKSLVWEIIKKDMPKLGTQIEDIIKKET